MRTRKEWLEWFRVDRDLIEHPKLTALAARGGWSTDKALGRLIRLWAWVAKHAPDGRLDDFQLQGLDNHLIDHEQLVAHGLDQTYADERCRCCHDPAPDPESKRLGARVAVFFSVGFLEEVGPDSFIVHDWIEMNGYALRERERDRERKSNQTNNSGGIPREIPGNSGGTARDSHRNRDGDVTDTSESRINTLVKLPLNESGSKAPLREKPTNGETDLKDWLEGFDLFWSEYPRKVAKEAARRAYGKIRPRKQETCDLIFAGLDLYKATVWPDRPEDKIEHAATWLNQRRFTDAAEAKHAVR